MPKTFAELETSTSVTPAELIETMADYARGGWAISPRCVLGLIRRIQLTPEERERLRALAEEGYQMQHNRSETKAAAEYRKVAEHLK